LRIPARFVSGGVETDGDGRPLPDFGSGWSNYRNPITGGNKDPLGNFFEKIGSAVDNPFSTVGKMLDGLASKTADAYFNATVAVVNRDRNGDGTTTDFERQLNWNDLGGKPIYPPAQPTPIYR
jgi:hypothetical protein